MARSGGRYRSRRLTVDGADLSAMMDREQTIAPHPGQNEAMIATKLILRYARFGAAPVVVPPRGLDTPSPTQRFPMQYGSDLDYLLEMAERFGYVLMIRPGPAPAGQPGLPGATAPHRVLQACRPPPSAPSATSIRSHSRTMPSRRRPSPGQSRSLRQPKPFGRRPQAESADARPTLALGRGRHRPRCTLRTGPTG